MSKGYTSNGKRLSAMTHANRGHECRFCDKVSFGNGGKVSHGRYHARRGEAIEMIKEYAGYPPMSHRVFVAPDEQQQWIEHGFRVCQT